MSHEILLILDLDETLIHASATKVRENFDLQLFPYFVYQRPALAEFLIACARHFKLAIWSSASDDIEDEELSHLGRYLLTLKDEANVRNIEKWHWRYHFSNYLID